MTGDTHSIEVLQHENERLRQRVAALESSQHLWKQTHADLEASEVRYRRIIETSYEGIWIIDTENCTSFANPRMAAMLGYSVEEMMGRPLFDFMDEEGKRLAAENVERRRQGINEQHDFKFKCKDGSDLWAIVSTNAMHDQDGQYIGALAMITDVTARRQAEEEIRRLQIQLEQQVIQRTVQLEQQAAELRTFQSLVENAPDGIAVAGIDGLLLYANPSYCQMLGYEAAEILGRPIANLVCEAELEALGGAMEVLLAGKPWSATMMHRRKDGSSVLFQSNPFVIRDTQGRPQAIGSINRDLTEQIRAQEERTALQQQVIDAQQAALRELSTPLMPIAEHVLAMPLIGAIDSSRAQLVMETLLQGIADYQAEIAILDITGVQVIDTQVANALIQIARCVRLLGAQIVLTGIQPRIAQTLVHLGVDLSDMVTRSNLQSGIAYALRQHSS